ncbi:MAG: hypothetical protein J0I08_23455 [Rhizobiales bacterium]|nr:hypothetical protein [Hyphomicrobiales bacterium]
MAENKMPAKIWCDRVDADMCRKQFRPDDITYIRADLVEPLVEALRKCALVCAGETITKSGLVDALDSARTALSSWESAQ